jgi:hypothetical protein
LSFDDRVAAKEEIQDVGLGAKRRKRTGDGDGDDEESCRWRLCAVVSFLPSLSLSLLLVYRIIRSDSDSDTTLEYKRVRGCISLVHEGEDKIIDDPISGYPILTHRSNSTRRPTKQDPIHSRPRLLNE